MVLPLLDGSLNAGPFGAYRFVPALFLPAVVFRALERVRLPARVAIIVGVAAATHLLGAGPAVLPLSIGVADALVRAAGNPADPGSSP